MRFQHVDNNTTIDHVVPNCTSNELFKYVLDVDLSGGWDDVPEYASTFLDDVVLPPFYGRTSVPGAATTPSPENGATDVFNENIVLSWNGVQFAKGYKVYV